MTFSIHIEILQAAFVKKCSHFVFSGDFTGFNGGGLRGGPEFLIEPNEKYYVTKSISAEVKCKAKAVHISFKCANSWIKQDRHVTRESFDSATMKTIVETSIEVTKDEVEEYYGSDGYWCECYASDQVPGQPGGYTVKSEKRGLIEVACKYYCQVNSYSMIFSIIIIMIISLVTCIML